MAVENVDDWVKAGKIAGAARDFGVKLVKKGVKIVDVCDAVDAKIKELGGMPAFPSQISCNHIAAHFCPNADDESVLDDQVASLDVGVHINGAIGDTAATVDLSGSYSDLVKASEAALKEALRIVAIDATLGDIGTAIQEVITSFGFTPVKNLSGHGLGLYEVHLPPTIPNVATGDRTPLEDGMTIAIEPFASTGTGIVAESGEPTVFSFVEPRPVRSAFAREVLAAIEEYGQLPFASRWVVARLGKPKALLGLKELTRAGVITSYPPLADTGKGITSQAEHSVLVGEKCKVLTKSSD